MRAIFLTLLFPLVTGPAIAQGLEWSAYEDDQFGCVLDYPASIFHADPPAPGQPQRYSSDEPTTYFRVQGVDNSNLWTPAAIRDQYLTSEMPGDVTYDRTRSDFVVLSGHRGSAIFYTKVAVSDSRRTACILEITYPRAEKRAFDGIVTRMSRSFRLSE